MSQETKAAAKKHVLVVDDNVELAQTYAELLELHDYNVTLAHDGVQALKFINQSDVDAIVCDLSMPQLEGDMFYNAAQHVRPELCRKFIFVTGNASHPKYEAFLKKTAVRVLNKPVPVSELVGALKDVIDAGV